MNAIFRRELGAYFKAPLGYIYLAIFFFFGGQFLQQQVGYYQTNDISYVFTSLFSIILFTMPLVTMRLMSEDKRLKTDQALLTAPISLHSIVWGKFLAAAALFSIGVMSTFIHFMILSFMSSPQWSIFISNFMGLILLGSALVSIGLFISSTTESQMIAAIGAFAAMFAIMMMDSIAALLPGALSFLANAIYSASFLTRYYNFTSGLINIEDILYFISVVIVFNFFSVRILEKKRWS